MYYHSQKAWCVIDAGYSAIAPFIASELFILKGITVSSNRNHTPVSDMVRWEIAMQHLPI